MNRAAMAMFGLTEPAEGKTVIEATVNASLDEAIMTALTDGGAVTLDLDVVLPEVRRLRAVVNATGGPSEQRAAVAVLHDLTESQKLERVRRDFVANVSHEMRTPVAGIQAMTESLLSGAMEDEATARRFLVHISRSCQRLVNIVDDLLQLARAESGVSRPRDPVPVAPIARDVVATLDAAIERNGLDVGVEADEHARVIGDPESLRQIISNLVDNAVKYTPAGGKVDVSVETSEKTVIIEVKDTGIGIPPESRDRVFERFYRVDAARSREMGGTGLGLSIVRHLVESMGGSVSVTSQVGAGSTFRVELPSAG
jgi:two-component system phosphate regulon sensor histidine kinase PhoR